MSPQALLAFLFSAAFALCLCGCGHPYMVRECGAVVGSHYDAREYAWVQPCHREDAEGCEESCRPARSACEADNAMRRDQDLWWAVTEEESRRNLRDIADRMDRDCPK